MHFSFEELSNWKENVEVTEVDGLEAAMLLLKEFGIKTV